MNYNNEYQTLLMCEKNIRFYQHLMATSYDPRQRVFFENLLNLERNKYYQIYYQYQLKYMSNNENDIYKSDLRQFTTEELLMM